MLGDDDLQHLAGALSDAGQAGVAPVALNRILLDVAVATQNLDGLVAGVNRYL